MIRTILYTLFILPEFYLNNMSDKEFIKKLGKRIKTLRKEKGLSQVGFAYDCGFEGSNLNRIESGNTNPSVKTLRIIARNLGVEFVDLFRF